MSVVHVSLNGDEFPNDTAYLKQIPGYWDSLVKASEEPPGEGLVYDPEILTANGKRKRKILT